MCKEREFQKQSTSFKRTTRLLPWRRAESCEMQKTGACAVCRTWTVHCTVLCSPRHTRTWWSRPDGWNSLSNHTSRPKITKLHMKIVFAVCSAKAQWYMIRFSISHKNSRQPIEVTFKTYRYVFSASPSSSWCCYEYIFVFIALNKKLNIPKSRQQWQEHRYQVCCDRVPTRSRLY